MATPSKFPIRISLIGVIAPGNEIEVRILIGHPMETGFRSNESGVTVSKNIIETIVVKLDRTELFKAKVGTGIAANPLVSLFMTIPVGGGTLEVEWQDDQGTSGRAQKQLLTVL